jgi:hypothetical protein
MLPLGIELRSYQLNLVHGFVGIAEFAWGTEPFWVGCSPKPELIDSSERKIQPHFVTGAIFAEIEGHCPHWSFDISWMQYLCF